MKYILVIISVLLCNFCFSQQSAFWVGLEKGSNNIGYLDTIIFNKDQHYKFANYDGPKPYYVGIWFPVKESNPNLLTYEDYTILKSHPVLSEVTDSMQSKQDWALNHYGLFNHDFQVNDEIKVPLEHIFNSSVAAFGSEYYDIKNPGLVIYHHGRGGARYENHVLFEYLASHGFVVISSNYHWPGLEDLTDLEDVEFIYDFAKSVVSDYKDLYYIGHSWGGGVALKLNQQSKLPFDRLIIFDSTLEHRGLEENAITSPHIDSLLKYSSNNFRVPTMVFSARSASISETPLKLKPFPEYLPYQYLNLTNFDIITLKESLNHGSFTSLALINAPFVKADNVADSLLKAQFSTYQYLVNLTINALEGKPFIGNRYDRFDPDSVNENFNIFFHKFSQDSAFQISRVRFPLKYIGWKDKSILSIALLEIKQDDWGFKSFLDDETPRLQIHDNHEGRYRDSGERLIHLWNKDYSKNLKYFFNRKDKKWYLTQIVELNNQE